MQLLHSAINTAAHSWRVLAPPEASLLTQAAMAVTALRHQLFGPFKAPHLRRDPTWMRDAGYLQAGVFLCHALREAKVADLHLERMVATAQR